MKKKITNNQFWEDFKEDDIAIHCKTPDQAKQLFKVFTGRGFNWCSGRTLDETDTNWECYNEETCYEFSKKGVAYADVEFFCDGDYTIIDFEDLLFFDKENPKIKDLMTGMILVSKDGSLSMVLRDTVNGDIISGQTWKSMDDLYFYGQRVGSGNCDYDIVEVWQPINNMDYLGSSCKWGEVELSTDNCELIYKLEVPKKMTKSEIEKELGYEIEIIE
jgi:hypothetical protein